MKTRILFFLAVMILTVSAVVTACTPDVIPNIGNTAPTATSADVVISRDDYNEMSTMVTQALDVIATATAAARVTPTIAPSSTPVNTFTPAAMQNRQTATPVPDATRTPRATATEEAEETAESDNLMDSPYMTNYQESLEYEVPEELQVPSGLLDGFTPVASLVMTTFEFDVQISEETTRHVVVDVPEPPRNVKPFECFPQDYSEGDDFNRGCAHAQRNGQLPWVSPIAGYNDGLNWSCVDVQGWCADDIQAHNWRVITGYEVCHPAVGCLKDPNGGAVAMVFVNFHDSDEVWSVRNNSAIYVDAGFVGYGVMWDLSGGLYDVGEGIGDIRNHYIYQLAYDVADDNRYRGQCGDSGLCETITYVVVARVWDQPHLGIDYSHFVLLDYGQWERPS